MSWSFGFVTKGTLGAYDDALKTAKSTYVVEQASFGNDVPDETLEQIDAAGAAGREVVRSHAVGATDETFNVVLAGHANPNHEPAPGFANDQLTVAIAQVT